MQRNKPVIYAHIPFVLLSGLAVRRPSSVNRTSMGCLLWWWLRPEANLRTLLSSWLPARVFTVTKRPKLLLLSDIHERTYAGEDMTNI